MRPLAPLTVELRESNWPSRLAAILIAATGLACCVTAGPASWFAAPLLAVAAGGMLWQRHQAPSVWRLTVFPDTGIEAIETGSGEVVQGRVADSSLVTERCIALTVVSEQRPLRLVLTAESAGADDLRRLRLRLRLNQSAPSAAR